MMEQAVKRLQKLGAFPGQEKMSCEFFQKAETMQELEKVMKGRNLGTYPSQYLHSHIHRLVAIAPEILEEAESRLAETGIRPEHIKDYFSIGSDAANVFRAERSRDYSFQKRNQFVALADEFALRKLRAWLGFS